MLVKRESLTGSNDLSTVYRPCTVEEIVGNQTNKNTLRNYLDNNKLPHTLLFSGPSGCGKTTVARIVALGLNCVEGPTASPCTVCEFCSSILNRNNMDVIEVNVGQSGGKDAVDNVVRDLPSSPFSSEYKVVIFDEAHKLTDAAKDLLLKEIEDGYAHVYFIFCTNQPEALKSKKKGGDAFLSRCTKMSFGTLSEEDMGNLLLNVVEFEGEPYTQEILDFIVTETKAIPRDALVTLNSVINEGSWSMEAVKSIVGTLVDADDPQIIELCRSIASIEWQESVKIFGTLVKRMPVESIRIAVCGYFVACLKRSKNMGEGKLFSNILNILNEPIYNTGKPAEQIFYNVIFRVIDIIQYNKYRKKK